ncbi:hypothetical protein ACTHQ2_25465, partial [Bacillus subtilis]|uniref:hypothetical protein n=1 Tax=Bacillus subtilis TaxID=1423 RepID=UPI003F7BE27C
MSVTKREPGVGQPGATCGRHRTQTRITAADIQRLHIPVDGGDQLLPLLETGSDGTAEVGMRQIELKGLQQRAQLPPRLAK